ncbi:MAG TPA: hypothetical protein VFY45_10170 [Baekduia sp.]|nr:hypothetical protein [Baekduia sp.]
MFEALVVAEYTSVRSEWLEARDAQQQSMQWTFAAIAVILAGIFSKDLRNTDPFVYALGTAVVAFASSLSQAIWFGEALRMERAALYLRGREQQLRMWLQPSSNESSSWPAVLAWETFRATRPDKQHGDRVAAMPRVVNSAVSIVAAICLYGVMWLAGIGLLAEATFSHASKLDGTEHTIAYWLFGGAAVTYLVITGYLVRHAVSVYRSSHQGANLDAIVWSGTGR